MSRWARLREGFPLTWKGAALLVLAALAFWFQGVGRLDLVLLSGSVLLVALLAALLVATGLAALALRRRLGGGAGPVRLECGAWAPTGFGLPLPAWLPFLAVRVAWVTPPGVQVRVPGGIEMVSAERRALGPEVVRWIRVGDILGLTEAGWLRRDAAPVVILPRRAALDPAKVLTGLVHGEDEPDPRGEPLGDRVDLRKYGHGDPMRMILWKVYARTRKAFVRIPERAVEPAPRVCAYLPASPGDEPPARLARTVLERGLLGPRWRFGADGAEDAQTLDEALAALAKSGSAQGPPGLGAFLERARRDGFGACILLLPGVDGPWTGPVQEALAASPLRLQAVFALDGWAPGTPSRWERLFLEPEAGGADPGAVLDLLSRLVLPGMGATLVETRSGDVLERPEAFLAKLAGRAA